MMTQNQQPVSAAQSGKAYRMGRIFGLDGKTVVLPLDHGTMLGRVAGLEDPVRALEAFLALSCDGFLIGPGLASRQRADVRSPQRSGPVAHDRLLLEHGRGGHNGNDRWCFERRRWASTPSRILMPWNTPASGRAATVSMISSVVEAAAPLGLPVMAEPIAFEMERGPEAVKIEADGCRVAMELGVDILEVAYPGDVGTLASWRSELHLPIVMLGGPQGGTTGDLLAMVADAVRGGANGIVIGRRVWQRPIDEAAALLEKLYAIVHSTGVSV